MVDLLFKLKTYIVIFYLLIVYFIFKNYFCPQFQDSFFRNNETIKIIYCLFICFINLEVIVLLMVDLLFKLKAYIVI